MCDVSGLMLSQDPIRQTPGSHAASHSDETGSRPPKNNTCVLPIKRCCSWVTLGQSVYFFSRLVLGHHVGVCFVDSPVITMMMLGAGDLIGRELTKAFDSGQFPIFSLAAPVSPLLFHTMMQ